MKQVKFIHGADIHLDSPMIGLRGLPENIFTRLQKSTFRAFHQLVDEAINHRVDFVILAGDLFDHEDRSIRAQVFLRKEMERLEGEGIEVFLVHGNHDYMKKGHNLIQLPPNVHVFGEKVELKVYKTSDTTVHLYGFSYHKRHVFEHKVDEYIEEPGADFHIGILHGNLEGSSEHGNYAPFQMKDLLAKNFHYWALGHIHKRAVLHENPFIIYSGNTQGRNKKEQGVKGCYFVTLHEAGAEHHFIETSDVIWTELRINAESITTLDALYELCVKELSKIRSEEKAFLVQLHIEHPSPEFDWTSMDELLDILQEEEQKEDSFVWPTNIHVNRPLEWNKQELKKDSDFYGELFSVIQEFEQLDETIAPLYQHHIARKHLSPILPKEEQELKAEAEKLLIEKLLRS